MLVYLYFYYIVNNLNSADVDYNDEVVEDCPLLSISNDIPVESSSMSTPQFDIFIRPFFDENQEHLFILLLHRIQQRTSIKSLNLVKMH